MERRAIVRPVAASAAKPPGEPNATSFQPTGFGPAYDCAAARMIEANHELEERQAELSLALEAGAPAAVVAELRREVASLEREYADAIAGMTAAPGRCETYYCPEAAFTTLGAP